MTVFEAGKEYRTRDGRRARVYATDGQPQRPIHGAVLDERHGWIGQQWERDGKASAVLPIEYPDDLMPPEPEIVVPDEVIRKAGALGTIRAFKTAFPDMVAANEEWLRHNGWVKK